jgi:putative flippase GtrA
LIREWAFRLVRSGAAGILATLAQFGTLWSLVSFAGTSPVKANLPALVFGSAVMFLGQKYFVYEARAAKTLWRETVLYAIVQVVGIGLTDWLYKNFLAFSPRLEAHYVIAGLIVNNLVWLVYFVPAWHFIFKRRGAPALEPLPVSVAPEADGE